MFKNKSISRSIFVSSDNQNLSQPFITGKLQICPMEYLNAVFRKLSVVPYNSAGTEKVCWKQGEICLRNNSKIHSRSLHFREEISGGVGVDFIIFFFPSGSGTTDLHLWERLQWLQKITQRQGFLAAIIITTVQCTPSVWDQLLQLQKREASKLEGQNKTLEIFTSNINISL